jgi:hypothetical protein
MGARADFFSKFGGLSMYRIEKPYYNNPKKPPFTEKYAKFHIQNIIVDQSKNDDECKACIKDVCSAFIWLEQGGLNKEPSSDQRKNCETQFVPLSQFIGQTTIRIVNIGSTKVKE